MQKEYQAFVNDLRAELLKKDEFREEKFRLSDPEGDTAAQERFYLECGQKGAVSQVCSMEVEELYHRYENIGDIGRIADGIVEELNKMDFRALGDIASDLTDYDNVVKYASCNQIFKDQPSPLYSDELKKKFKATDDLKFGKQAAEKKQNNNKVDEAYIKKYCDYADERIKISNAIIYFDMIKKTSDGFGSSDDPTGMRDDGSDQLFMPPSAKKNKYDLAA